MRDRRRLQHLRERLGLLDRGGADEHRLAGLVRPLDLGDDRLVLLAGGAEDLVVVVLADHRHVGRHLDDAELVDLEELVGLGRGGAGHAGELLVEAEVVLEGDARERDVLRADADALLRLDRLVQAFREAAARHHPAGELVDQDDLAVADDVVLVAVEEDVGAERLVDVVDDVGALGVVERRVLREQLHLAQPALDELVAVLGERRRALLLVEVVVLARELRDQLVDRDVEPRAVLARAGDDEGSARLVDQDRIDLVDDREVVIALQHLGQVGLHVVAQVVEAELVVRRVGDVGVVGDLLRRLLHARHHHADAQAQRVIDEAHPLGVAAGEVVVDGDDVDAAPGQRVEIDRERRHQRLALAGLHLGNVALVQEDAAHELHVEGAQAERPARRLAGVGEGLRQQLVERCPLGEPLAELGGPGADRGVVERLELRFQRVDRVDERAGRLDLAVVGRAEDLLRDRPETHHETVVLKSLRACPAPLRRSPRPTDLS